MNTVLETSHATGSSKSSGGSLVDAATIKKSSLILRALNHKLRQAIIEVINDKGKTTVTEIYVKLRLEQSVASQHLAILRRAGIVKPQRDGKFIRYALNHDYLKHVGRLAADMVR